MEIIQASKIGLKPRRVKYKHWQNMNHMEKPQKRLFYLEAQWHYGSVLRK